MIIITIVIIIITIITLYWMQYDRYAIYIYIYIYIKICINVYVLYIKIIEKEYHFLWNLEFHDTFKRIFSRINYKDQIHNILVFNFKWRQSTRYAKIPLYFCEVFALE